VIGQAMKEGLLLLVDNLFVGDVMQLLFIKIKISVGTKSPQREKPTKQKAEKVRYGCGSKG
jgi:hypothetical protein